MNIRVFSKQQLTNYLADIRYKIAVISFYEPGEKPLPLPDDIRKYYVKAYDNDRDKLKLRGISYGKFLPEADSLAEFIFDAYKEKYDIICQCRYGQSMSAGCGAAIAEYFEKDGIRIFSDYRFSPNQSVYNKVYNALKRAGGSQPDRHNEAYIFSRRYYELYLQKCRSAGENYTDVLDFLSDAEDIIADSYGADSVYIADVLADRGLVLGKMKQYDKAVSTFERAAEIYREKDRKSDINYAVEMLAKTLVNCGKINEAISAAESVMSYNVQDAKSLLAYIYSRTEEYALALNELQQLCDTAETSRKKAKALREIGRVYYMMGEKGKAVSYLSEAYEICYEQLEKNLSYMEDSFEMSV